LVVTLRGLTIRGTAPEASQGIFADAVNSLNVEKCTISGFGRSDFLGGTGGLIINTSNVAGNVVVTDTIISDCPGSGITNGNFGNPANASLVVEGCKILSNGQGVAALSNGRATVRDTLVAHNVSIGIQGGGVAASNVKMNVENCVVTANGTGILSFTTTNVTVSNSTITGNTIGVAGSSGMVNPMSFGNNRLSNNATDGTFGTVVTQK
jgi:hypothetical protein